MQLKGSNKTARDFIIESNGSLFYTIDLIDSKKKEKKKSRLLNPSFTSIVQKNLPTSDVERHSKAIDVSHLRTFTFLVINNGNNPILSQVEMSPDRITWGTFGELELTIPPGQKQVMVPQFFLRFVRIKFKNKNYGFNSVITIWFQGQC